MANLSEPRGRALSMRSAVHALGAARFGSCPLAPVARTQRPRVVKSVLSRLSRYAGGLRHPQRSGGLGVRGDLLKSWWSFRKGLPPEIYKDPSDGQLGRAREHEWPRARRAVARLAGWLAACFPALACQLAYRLAYSPGSREPGWTVAVG